MSSQEQEIADDEWITMSEAARRLGTTPNKLSRMADKGQIQARKDPFDDRVRLVNYAELYRLFGGTRHRR